MNEAEQLHWCGRNCAIVRFEKDGVKVRLENSSGAVTIKSPTLQEAIGHIEKSGYLPKKIMWETISVST